MVLSVCLFVAQPLASYTQGGPKFEAVSIKPHDMRQFAQPAQIDPAYVRVMGVSLTSLVMDAYRLKVYQIHGPAWMKEVFFDIVAKLAPDSTREQVPAMIQELLAERFHLRSHWEYPTESVFALTAPKLGAGVRPSPEEEVERFHVDLAHGRIEARAMTFDELADRLTAFCSERPIINHTGIPGRFNLVLDVGTESINPALAVKIGDRDVSEPGVGAADAAGNSLVRALRSLGLDIKLQRLGTKRLYVDTIDRIPTPN